MKTGKRIQSVASAELFAGILASVVFGGIQIANAIDAKNPWTGGIISGVLTIIFGSIAAYVLYLVLRGFGETVENTAAIREKLAPEFVTAPVERASKPKAQTVPAAPIPNRTKETIPTAPVTQSGQTRTPVAPQTKIQSEALRKVMAFSLQYGDDDNMADYLYDYYQRHLKEVPKEDCESMEVLFLLPVKDMRAAIKRMIEL